MKRLKKIWAFLLTAAIAVSSLTFTGVNASAANLADYNTTRTITQIINDTEVSKDGRTYNGYLEQLYDQYWFRVDCKNAGTLTLSLEVGVSDWNLDLYDSNGDNVKASKFIVTAGKGRYDDYGNLELDWDKNKETTVMSASYKVKKGTYVASVCSFQEKKKTGKVIFKADYPKASASSSSKSSGSGIISARISDIQSGSEFFTYLGNDLYFITDNESKKGIYKINRTALENWRKTGKLKAVKITVDSRITKHSDWGHSSNGDFSNGNYGVLGYTENGTVHLVAVKYNSSKNKITPYYDTTNAISLSPDGYISETDYDKSSKQLTLGIISPKGKKIKTHKFDYSEYEGSWFGFSGGDSCVVTRRKYVGDNSKDGSGWDGEIFVIDKSGKKTTLTDTAPRAQVKGKNYFAYSPIYAVSVSNIYSFDTNKFYYNLVKETSAFTEGEKTYELDSLGTGLYGTKAVARYSHPVSSDKYEYKYALVDISSGKFISKKYDDMVTKDNGKTYLVKFNDGKWGYLDSSGKELAEFDDAAPFIGSGKYAPVIRNGKVYLINRSMKRVTKAVKLTGIKYVSGIAENVFFWYDGKNGHFMTIQ